MLQPEKAINPTFGSVSRICDQQKAIGNEIGARNAHQHQSV